jgi:ABC-type proline/glycine betaine transport system ATPase subunit
VKIPSLTVGLGESPALAGDTGYGKTSTRNMINRLIAPSRVSIRLQAKDIGAAGAARLRRRIG